MTTKKAKFIVGEKNWKAFLRWMEGQTVGVYDNGETNWYPADVFRFSDAVAKGRIPHIND